MPSARAMAQAAQVAQEAQASQLCLQVVFPVKDRPEGEVEKSTQHVDKECTGAAFKHRLQYITQMGPDDQLLYFQNDHATDSKVLLDDEMTMEAHGVKDGALITVRRKVLNWKFGEGQGSKQHIARHGRLSYYHANRHDPDLPEDLKIALGGEPVRLQTAEEAHIEPEAEKVGRIEKFSWANDGKSLKVFIDAAENPRTLAAASAKGAKVDLQCEQRGFRMTVEGVGGEKFELNVPNLYMDIAPRLSKVRVSEGKKITVSLRKVDEEHDWYMLHTRSSEVIHKAVHH